MYICIIYIYICIMILDVMVYISKCMIGGTERLRIRGEGGQRDRNICQKNGETERLKDRERVTETERHASAWIKVGVRDLRRIRASCTPTTRSFRSAESEARPALTISWFQPIYISLDTQKQLINIMNVTTMFFRLLGICMKSKLQRFSPTNS